jgi:hypothetical protein
MMWQKAKIIDSLKTREILGAFIWTTGVPELCGSVAHGHECTYKRCDTRVIRANWFSPDNPNYVNKIHMTKIELLDEFAEEVELISYDDFVAKCAKAAEEANS